MAEQLTWEGLLPTNPNEKKQEAPKKTAPKQKPATVASETKSKANSDIEARINALIEAKKLAEIKAGKTLVVKTEIKETVTEEITVFDDVTEKPSEREPEILSVTNLNKQIKNLLEKNFPFLWVKGEISNLKIPASGHLYFTLKDSTAQVRAVMFRGFTQSVKFKPEDGMEVLVRCRVTAYEPRGDYQLFCEVMEPVGFGALQVAFEQLKEKLKNEGLFDLSRKRQLPAFPKSIGIITSPTGAAIRDMINILSRRFSGGLEVMLIPTSVQGDKAPGEIVAAIELANRIGRFDVLIVGRGGGSIEDLWAFNTESVVRAVCASKIPTISAVGHEVDFTICDFVADLRAPTPSAAAELVVRNKKDLSDRIKSLERQILNLVRKKLTIAKANVDGIAKRLIDPKRRLQDLMLRCDEWTDRLIQGVQRFLQTGTTEIRFLRERLGTPQRKIELYQQKLLNSDTALKTSMNRFVENKRADLAKSALLLNGLSPLAILGRGYSIVKKGEVIVSDITQVSRGDKLTIKMHKGELNTEVI
jgi:exodeoxyribonuclease VII large subunit